MIQADIHYGPSTTVVSVTFLMSPKNEKDVQGRVPPASPLVRVAEGRGPVTQLRSKGPPNRYLAPEG